MNFFKFKSATDPTTLDQGEQINYLTKTMWVERYAAPGEFKFESQLSNGLKEFLPIGTLVSHADTLEVMIVENHEIKESEQEDPAIVATGRSFVSYLENRIVGTTNARSPAGGNLKTPYLLTADYTWNQIVTLINDFIANPTWPNDSLVGVVASALVSGTGMSVERPVEFGSLLERVLDILKVDDLGIRTVRKNTFGIGSSTNTLLQVYKGIDRSAKIFFSWKSGDLSSVGYLFSNKNDKNSVIVVGQYVVVAVDTGPTKYDRRIMMVDGSDIDGHLGASPAGSDITKIVQDMTTLGQMALAAQNSITISTSDISETSPYQFRRDYDIGDLVTLDGNYGQIGVFRVTEYAEIEDETGESGHPTLSIPGV
jgi:hypothetical protein